METPANGFASRSEDSQVPMARDADPSEGILEKVTAVAEGQKEIVDRVRELQETVDKAVALLQAAPTGAYPGHAGRHSGQAWDKDKTKARGSSAVTTSIGIASMGVGRVASISSIASSMRHAQSCETTLNSIVERETLLCSLEDKLDQGPDDNKATSDMCPVLPPGWPVSIHLRKEFQNSKNSSFGSDIAIAAKATIPRSYSAKASLYLKENNKQRWCYLGPWNPHSSGNLVFDLLGLVVLLYDLGVTPVQLAWSAVISGPFSLCNCISVMYWTICMCVTFRTGFYERGELRMNSKDIAWNYLGTLFIFDLLLIMVDWVMIASSGARGTLGALRIFRLFKVARLLKAASIIDKLATDACGNERTGLVLVKVGGFTLAFTHTVCCAVYAVSTMKLSDTGEYWIDSLPDQDNVCYTYLVAHHWVLSQITLGGHDVKPTNSSERAGCIALNIFGLLYSSTIISMISAKALEYVTLRRGRMEDMSRLASFLDQHKVELSIANRVRRQANDRLKTNSLMLSEGRVRVLSLLSTDLQSELLNEVRSPHTVTHPLFQLWARIDIGSIRRLCLDAVCFVTLMPQDCAFEPGVIATETFYITPLHTGSTSGARFSGAICPMLYMQSEDTSFVDGEETCEVNEGTWVAEAALWTEWIYVGKFTARYACQLLAVDASKLQATVSAVRSIGEPTRTYAREFCMRVHAAAPPFSAWPNDLHVPFADPSHLLSGQAYAGLLTSEWKAGHLSISKEGYEELLEEVNSQMSTIVSVPGKAASSQSPSRRPGSIMGAPPPLGLQRVVFVTALQLQRTDGHVLVQVGKWTEGSCPDASFAVLPGTKRYRSELPHKALRRLLKNSLRGLEDRLVLTHTTEEAEYKESRKYGMMTQYLRTVNYAYLPEDFEMPLWPRAKFISETPPNVQCEIKDLPSYCSTPVYVLHTQEGKADLYAWLSEEDIDMARGQEQDILQSWIESLDPASCRQAGCPANSVWASSIASRVSITPSLPDSGMEDW